MAVLLVDTVEAGGKRTCIKLYTVNLQLLKLILCRVYVHSRRFFKRMRILCQRCRKPVDESFAREPMHNAQVPGKWI